MGDVDISPVGGEQEDDGLTAELVLELDVVDRDLRVRVQVAVLPGREVEVGRAEQGEHQRDREDPDRDQLPLLPQPDREGPPE